MNPEQKKYILENARRQSVSEIAKYLGVKERKIRKFINRQSLQPVACSQQPAAQSMYNPKIAFFSILLIIVLGFAVYANSIDGKAIWDDRLLITKNVYIRDWSHLSKMFSTDLAAGAGMESCSYRPFQLVSYAADYSLWKDNLKGFHVTNIILHILTALGVFWLINLLFNDRLLSLLTGLFFAVHPIHNAAVSYLAGRADPLVTLLMMASFINYIRFVRTDKLKFYIYMFACFLPAVFSRENSMIFPALLLLYHFTFKVKPKFRDFLPILAAMLFFILVRKGIASPLPHALTPVTAFERVPGFFVALTNYVRLLIAPYNLHMEYGDKIFRFIHAKAIIGYFIFAFLMWAAWRNRNKNRIVFLSIAWFVMTLLPSSNIYPLRAYMAEHWLYIPSIGFFLLLAYGLEKMGTATYFFNKKTGKNRWLSLFFLIALIAFYSYTTVKQNAYWSDPVTFYERTLKFSPSSPRVHNDVGVEYFQMGDQKKAKELFERAVELKPDYADAYNNLGVAYNFFGENKKAIDAFEKTIRFNPKQISAYGNLGFLYASRGKREKGLQLLKKALEVNPDFPETHNYLSLFYLDEKNYEMAIKHCDIARRLGYKINPEILKKLEPYR